MTELEALTMGWLETQDDFAECIDCCSEAKNGRSLKHASDCGLARLLRLYRKAKQEEETRRTNEEIHEARRIMRLEP